jgi:hypothetical protein
MGYHRMSIVIDENVDEPILYILRRVTEHEDLRLLARPTRRNQV